MDYLSLPNVASHPHLLLFFLTYSLSRFVITDVRCMFYVSALPIFCCERTQKGGDVPEQSQAAKYELL